MIDQTPHDEFSIAVDHVSETAYMVSAYRLLESKRSDRHFDDSIAAKLLGDNAESVLSRFSSWNMGEWMMAVRTTLIDRMILKLIGEGVDTVVNLAAGLDTRPYRMALPSSLNWIEADFKGIIEFKTNKLASEKPVCQLKRVEVDLADPKERMSFFSTFKDLGRFIVLTEGLLLYLEAEDVKALSQNLLSYSNLKAWLTDFSTISSFKAMNRISGVESTATGERKKVHFKFLPEEGIHYFEPLGWTVKEFYNYCEYGKLLNRHLPMEADLNESDLKDMKGTGFGILTHEKSETRHLLS